MVDKCYLAVKFDNEENPMFGKLCDILQANISLVFDVIFLRVLTLILGASHLFL